MIWVTTNHFQRRYDEIIKANSYALRYGAYGKTQIPKGGNPLKIVTVSKDLFSPISLPGMGRSIEMAELPEREILDLRKAFAQGELYVTFTEEPDTRLMVKQMWINPHAPQATLFV